VQAKDDNITAYAWYVLAILTLFHAMHTIDRNVIYVVLEPLKHEFDLSDGGAGAIAGLAHGMAFAIFSIPIGWLADRTNRSKLLPIMAAAWGIATLFCGAVSSAKSLFLARMAVGATEGGTMPACLSLINDYFPPHRRATAQGIFFISIAIGSAVTFTVGAVVAERYGWRYAFFLAGLPVILLAVIGYLTLREPVRGRFESVNPGEAEAHLPLRKVPGTVLKNRPLLFGVLGQTLATTPTSALYAFAVSYFVRSHDLTLADAGIMVALGTGVASAIGSVAGGPIADRIMNGASHRVGYFPGALIPLTVVAGAVMLLSPTLPLAVAGFFCMAMLIGAWLPQGYAVPFSLAPAGSRATMLGLTQLFTNLIGTGSGPVIAGLLSDRIGGADSLRYALFAMLLIYPVASLLFIMASRTAGAERARALTPLSV
jgi:MFS family permease